MFGDDEASDSEAVRRSWEAIKAAERAERLGNSPSPLSDQLTEKVRGMPALAGAMTISKKAAKAGFEWDDLDGVWDKVHEELDELKEAVASGDRQHAQEELGDLLFTLVNVARWCDIAPEEGLADLIRDGLRPPPPARKPTRPGRGAVRRRLDAKKQRGDLKRQRRQRPSLDD